MSEYDEIFGGLNNVLSLFDGISCGRLALDMSGTQFDNYFASEIDKNAIAISEINFPDQIQVGDVRSLDANTIPSVRLLIGGSPCQSFSFAGTRKGMATATNEEITTLEQYLQLKDMGFEFEGQSYLFWEYVRLKELFNPEFFFLENVRMSEKWEDLISEIMGVEPVKINSAENTAGNRRRLYWTNLPFSRDTDGRDSSLADIVEDDVCIEKTYEAMAMLDLKGQAITNYDIFYTTKGVHETLSKESNFTSRFYSKAPGTLARKKAISQLRTIDEKANCLTTSGQNLSNSGSTNLVFIDHNGKLKIRPLTPLECERLQGVPENYTSIVQSTGSRIKTLGNGWTVPIIARFFVNLPF